MGVEKSVRSKERSRFAQDPARVSIQWQARSLAQGQIPALRYLACLRRKRFRRDSRYKECVRLLGLDAVPNEPIRFLKYMVAS